MEPSEELCQKRNHLYTACTYCETAISPLYHILILFSFQRNAWHISGGEGAAANSANRRVLVTRPDGSQYVEEIKNDLGLKSGDKEGMMSRLNAQGVNATSASGYGSAGDNSNGFGKAPLRSNSTNIVGRMLSRPQSFQSNRDETNNNEYGIILLNALKEQLISRDSKGLIGLQRQFRTMDEDGSNSLDISEFKKAMLETNVRMKKASDAEILFKLFGKYYFFPILTPTSSVNNSVFFVLYQIRIFGCCFLGN